MASKKNGTETSKFGSPGRMNHNSSKFITACREKANMPGLVPKWFRHSKISKWQRDGLND